MAIIYNENEKLFNLETKNSTYQIKIDRFGFLIHLYYGKKITGSAEYLLRSSDRGFSGNPHEAGGDRTYSMDVYPQEYSTQGVGVTNSYQNV